MASEKAELLLQEQEKDKEIRELMQRLTELEVIQTSANQERDIGMKQTRIAD